MFQTESVAHEVSVGTQPVLRGDRSAPGEIEVVPENEEVREMKDSSRANTPPARGKAKARIRVATCATAFTAVGAATMFGALVAREHSGASSSGATAVSTATPATTGHERTTSKSTSSAGITGSSSTTTTTPSSSTSSPTVTSGGSSTS